MDTILFDIQKDENPVEALNKAASILHNNCKFPMKKFVFCVPHSNFSSLFAIYGVTSRE